MKGRVVSVNAAPRGGVPKPPVASALVTTEGLANDKQRDRRFHGGPDRAVCLFSLDVIHALQQEGHPIQPGTAGENLTISGVDWSAVAPGMRVTVGPEVELELVSFTPPCQKIRESFKDGEFTRISQKLHPGWSRVYARVLEQGTVRAGDAVQFTPP